MYAYGVIRGFPYQVDLTIDRRLSLRAGAALELERGGTLTPCCVMAGYTPGVLLIIIPPVRCDRPNVLAAAWSRLYVNEPF